jgi:agmatine/peptidylarginine deiminase
MLTWPHAGTPWGGSLEAVYPVFATLGAAISHRQRLLCVCNSTEHARLIAGLLEEHQADTAQLRFALAPSDDSWARDHGPLSTLQDGQASLHDLRFNGWGGKYPAARDDAINGVLARQGVFGRLIPKAHDLVLEGGAIETDGQGTLLATRSSVLARTRNPSLDQAAVEEALRQTLGLSRFFWLDHGDISGDDTDGHIDTLARFSDPQTILYATAPEGNRDHDGLAAMENELRQLRTRDHQPYRLLALPFAGEHREQDGRRLPATYANFLIINGAVLLPTYGVPADRSAGAVLQQAFPGREIIPIDCREIIRQNGSLHCLTMQFPATVQLHNGQEFVAP